MFSLNEVELKSSEMFQEFCDEVNSYRETPYALLTFTYSFTQTALGVTCKVKCNQLDLHKDVTDYECW